MKLFIGLVVCLACIFAANAANILVVFPMPSRSHQILGEELTKALLKKGHHVTMASAYRVTEKLENFTGIYLDGLVEYKEKQFAKVMTFNNSKIESTIAMLKQDTIPRMIFENKNVKALLSSDKKFDVYVLELMLSESLLAFGHHYKVPTVVFHPFGSAPMVDRIVGNSHPFAYVPSVFIAATDEMTFFERVKNVLMTLLMDLMFLTIFLPQQRSLVEQYFPDAPPLDDLIHNVSLVLLNTQFSLVETPRPYMPNMVPIGGFHVQPQTLPQDLKQFLDNSKEGVVLFSLGSNVKSADLPPENVDAILKTFSKFPQKFLWKFEEEGLGVPKNVKISKWLPQRAVLDHPNVKAFITHGGLLSITEAIYYGVPFIGIPAFGDQGYNVAYAVHRKLGLQYDMNALSEETFTAAIKEILQNPIYKQNIAIRSSILRKQPVPPSDLAVYWIEHVIKYGGAPHLQSAGVKLSWYQAYLLDVIGFLVAIFSIVIYVNYLIARKCLRFVCRKFHRKQKVKAA